ncbi:chorismate lyase [Marinobacterium lutimaris]|uniref:Probable chorismate pyruvate-lyase n=1 Tax=Marinobacterium lutimaris TaxID=568106 RepID=A0A1H6DEI2_9GAMM|nr:chorismate lyase [Marinobacterium lutimaris]
MKANRPQPETARHWRQLKQPIWAPRHLRRWLTDHGSLTRLLKRASKGRFSVRVVRQGYHRPGPAEAAALRLRSRQQALIREVYLCGAGEPWVYARTVIPVTTLSGSHRTLKLIGSRSLGSLLFRDPSMQRQPLQIARLNEGLWARRSVFHLERKPLLVCEVFLPSLEHIQYPAC